MKQSHRERLIAALDRQSEIKLAADSQAARLALVVYEQADVSYRTRLQERDLSERGVGALVEPGRTLDIRLYQAVGGHLAHCEKAVGDAQELVNVAQSDLDEARQRIWEDRLRLRKLGAAAQIEAQERNKEREMQAQIETDELWLSRIANRETPQ